MILAIVLVFVSLVALDTPVAFAIGIAVAAALALFSDIPLIALPHKMVTGIDIYVLLAIPLFLLAGRLMNAGGITERLFRFARVMVGSVHGGLANANVVATMLFSGMSGSAVAAVGALGETEVRAMKRGGYDTPFAAAVATAASVLGPIIPPSIPMIIYAAMAEQSVGRLFMGGVVPGLLMGAALMITISWIARRRGYPRDEAVGPTEKLRAAREAVVPLLMPVIMLGGIASGIFTPTEAAAVAAAYALFVSMAVYRTVRPRDLPGLFVDSMVGTAIILFIISTTQSLSFLLTVEDAGARLGGAVVAWTSNKYVVLLLVNVLLLVLGALMEAGVVLILFIPILTPLVFALGVDPIHFGIIMCANLMIGVATPPVGVCLFMMSHIGEVRVETLMRAVLPLLVPIVLVLFVLTYVPGVVLWLPDWVAGW
jgi:tripartite ATP-independent transporter DctM subunit